MNNSEIKIGDKVAYKSNGKHRIGTVVGFSPLGLWIIKSTGGPKGVPFTIFRYSSQIFEVVTSQ